MKRDIKKRLEKIEQSIFGGKMESIVYVNLSEPKRFFIKGKQGRIDLKNNESFEQAKKLYENKFGKSPCGKLYLNVTDYKGSS